MKKALILLLFVCFNQFANATKDENLVFETHGGLRRFSFNMGYERDKYEFGLCFSKFHEYVRGKGVKNRPYDDTRSTFLYTGIRLFKNKLFGLSFRTGISLDRYMKAEDIKNISTNHWFLVSFTSNSYQWNAKKYFLPGFIFAVEGDINVNKIVTFNAGMQLQANKMNDFQFFYCGLKLNIPFGI